MAVGGLVAAPLVETVRRRLKWWSYKQTDIVQISKQACRSHSSDTRWLKQRRVRKRSKVRVPPGVVKLLSMFDPSQDSTALSTDGSVLNAL